VEALRLFQEIGIKVDILAALESLAVAALIQGRKERAARLAGAAAARREALRLPGPDWWLRPKERIDEAVRAAFLEREFAAAWAEGAAMTLQEAIDVALEEGTEA
jgi:non-specific serine/threonine protein kinase